jgi:hypothetical protein
MGGRIGPHPKASDRLPAGMICPLASGLVASSGAHNLSLSLQKLTEVRPSSSLPLLRIGKRGRATLTILVISRPRRYYFHRDRPWDWSASSMKARCRTGQLLSHRAPIRAQRNDYNVVQEREKDGFILLPLCMYTTRTDEWTRFDLGPVQ